MLQSMLHVLARLSAKLLELAADAAPRCQEQNYWDSATLLAAQ